MIETIGVCGAGTMGSGIAQTAAMAGFRTILYDLAPAMVQKGRAAIEKNLAALVEKNKLTPDQLEATLERISYAYDIKDCTADLVIEAIVEKPEAKLDLFLRLAACNSPETILVSNTSSLSLNTLAAKIPDPARFAGMHFFNPAPLMRLVEVVYTDHTREETTQTVMEVARQMGKTPVLCKDAPGFIVNHVARPYYLEALRLVSRGLADIETVDALMEAAGFRMGPFRLMDLIGNDINFAVSESVYEAMGRPQRLQPSALQAEKVGAGLLGRKSGKGWYDYGATTPTGQALTTQTSTSQAPGIHPSSAPQPSVKTPSLKVLVTGGTGFLGSYIIRELVEKGYSVRAIRRRDIAPPFYLPASLWEKVDWFLADIRDPLGLEEAMAGVDAVIHAAAKISFSPEDRKELFSINIDGTTHVINAALSQQVKRLIHVSSVAALGRIADGGEVTEEKVWEDNKTNTNYAISKFHGEMEVWRGIGEGLPAAIVNPGTILGYGDWKSSSCALFRSAFNEFPWYTEGINGFVDVADTAKAIVLLLESDVTGQRFILNSENWTWRRLFETLAADFGKKPPSRKATPFLAGLAWRMEKMKSVLTGKPALLTRESAMVAGSSTSFNNAKILRQLPGFHFTPLDQSIREACKKYLILPS